MRQISTYYRGDVVRVYLFTVNGMDTDDFIPGCFMSFCSRRLLSALKNRGTDDYERARSNVSLAITTRGIFSKETRLEFNVAGLTVEQGIAVTTSALD